MQTQPEFTKKLNEWINEEINLTITVPKLTDDGKSLKSLESVVVKVPQKTMYLKEETVFKSCQDHYWELKNNDRCMFECKHCGMGCIAPPWKYEWNDGKLTAI